MYDCEEMYDPDDAAKDSDLDGVGELEEQLYGTNPHVTDSDGDSYVDGGIGGLDPEPRDWHEAGVEAAIDDPSLPLRAGVPAG